MQTVVNRRSLAEELGVGDDRDVVSAERLTDDADRTHRHGGLVDDDRARPEQRRDLAGRGAHVGEVGRAVVVLRGGNAQEHDVGVADGLALDAEFEAQPAGGAAGRDQLGQALFEDRDLTVVEALDLVGVDIAADDIGTEMGECGAGGQTDVTRADDHHLGRQRTIAIHDALHYGAVSRRRGRSARRQRCECRSAGRAATTSCRRSTGRAGGTGRSRPSTDPRSATFR